jgi:hypothetical protein
MILDSDGSPTAVPGYRRCRYISSRVANSPVLFLPAIAQPFTVHFHYLVFNSSLQCSSDKHRARRLGNPVFSCRPINRAAVHCTFSLPGIQFESPVLVTQAPCTTSWQPTVFLPAIAQPFIVHFHYLVFNSSLQCSSHKHRARVLATPCVFAAGQLRRQFTVHFHYMVLVIQSLHCLS